MKNKKQKSPLILNQSSGKLPKYDKKADHLLALNSKLKKKIQELKGDKWT